MDIHQEGRKEGRNEGRKKGSVFLSTSAPPMQLTLCCFQLLLQRCRPPVHPVHEGLQISDASLLVVELLLIVVVVVIVCALVFVLAPAIALALALLPVSPRIPPICCGKGAATKGEAVIG